MPSNLILGQVAPSAATLTTLYTVPSATKTVISSIMVCNRGSTQTTFRIAIRNGGVSVSNEHYIYYDVTINGNDTFKSTMGGVLPASTVVSVYAGNGNLSFNLFGEENS